MTTTNDKKRIQTCHFIFDDLIDSTTNNNYNNSKTHNQNHNHKYKILTSVMQRSILEIDVYCAVFYRYDGVKPNTTY